MKSLAQRWNHFWFEPTTADNLGLCRIVLYGSMFLFYVLTPLLSKSWGWHANFTLWGKVSPAFWTPVGLFALLHLPQLSTGPLMVIQTVWWVALAFSCVGLFTRLSTAASFLLGLYLFGLPNNFGKIHHLDLLLFWAFLVMACSRCGDAWSLDAMIRSADHSSAAKRLLSGEYTWPVHFMWVVTAVVYAEAGLAKLRHSGIAWLTTATMQNYLLQAYYHVSDSEPLTRWGLYLARHHWMASALGAGAIIFEVGILFAIVSPKARWIFVPGVISMHAGIALFMGPNFYQMMLCQALWVPWDRVVQKLGARFGKSRRHPVIVDRGSLLSAARGRIQEGGAVGLP